MTPEETLRELIKRVSGVDLPISGGDGDSIEDAIKIDKDYRDWSDVEYTLLRVWHRLIGRRWKLSKQTTITQNGRTYDRMELAVIVPGDENIYSATFYFDITDHLDAPLFAGGTNWPDEETGPSSGRFILG